MITIGGWSYSPETEEIRREEGEESDLRLGRL